MCIARRRADTARVAAYIPHIAPLPVADGKRNRIPCDGVTVGVLLAPVKDAQPVIVYGLEEADLILRAGVAAAAENLHVGCCSDGRGDGKRQCPVDIAGLYDLIRVVQPAGRHSKAVYGE